MPREIQIDEISKRLTHKFVGSYQHADEWEPLGKFRTMSKRTKDVVRDEEGDPCEPRATYLLGTVEKYDAATPDADIRQGLRDSFSHVGCAHDYDCCGCRSYRARARQVKGRWWAVRISSSRNF